LYSKLYRKIVNPPIYTTVSESISQFERTIIRYLRVSKRRCPYPAITDGVLADSLILSFPTMVKNEFLRLYPEPPKYEDVYVRAGQIEANLAMTTIH